MIVDLVLAAPRDEDVVAGPIGFVIFIGLCLAVALLGWSLNKHLKKADRAEEAGVYGHDGAAHESHESHESSESSGGTGGSDGSRSGVDS